MSLSRRQFFRNSAMLTAAAAAAALPESLAAWQEPSRARTPGGPILLNSNENPYGPWPELTESMRASWATMNRYPDHESEKLQRKVAALHRVAPEQVMLGCGSGELLRVLADVFCKPGTTLVQAAPTFESLGHHARVRGANVRSVPLDANYAHDLPNMLADEQGRPPALVHICNPNNPTASLTPRKSIEDFLAKLSPDSHVLIDEAYHHFATGSPDYVSFLDKPLKDERVIVTRTFSKIYGLAGMRLGYAVASPDVAAQMRPYVMFDNVNMMATHVGSEAIEDMEGMARAAKRNENDRAAFTAEAKRRGLKFIPSWANFAMLDTGRPIQQAIDHFKQHDVLIGRPFPPLATMARVSFGTPEEMRTFWQVWDSWKH